jgi:predicted nuclease of predicted toxin-antitoxin system
MTTLSVLCDENVDRQVIAHLHREGHEGEHVVDVLEPGADDESDTALYAREHDRLVLTKDTDFLSMGESEHAGVLFVEDHRLSAHEIASILFEVAAPHPRSAPGERRTSPRAGCSSGSTEQVSDATREPAERPDRGGAAAVGARAVRRSVGAHRSREG